MSSNQVKHLLVAMVAVFAVGAVGASAASAHRFVNSKCVPWTSAAIAWETKTKCENQNPLGGDPVKNWELEGIAGTKVEGTSGVSKLSATLSGVTLTIECKKDKLSGTLGTGGKSSNTKITYEECAITGGWSTKCEVATTLITSKLKDSLSASGRIEDTFEPEPPATVFIEIVVKARSGKT